MYPTTTSYSSLLLRFRSVWRVSEVERCAGQHQQGAPSVLGTDIELTGSGKRLFSYVTTPTVTTTTTGSETIWSAGSGKPFIPSGRYNTAQPVSGFKTHTQTGKINGPVLFQTGNKKAL